jgi:hypothetical protein
MVSPGGASVGVAAAPYYWRRGSMTGTRPVVSIRPVSSRFVSIKAPDRLAGSKTGDGEIHSLFGRE